MVANKAGHKTRGGNGIVSTQREKYKIKGKRCGAQVLSLVAKRRGQPGTHRRD